LSEEGKEGQGLRRKKAAAVGFEIEEFLSTRL
jgi:hypothetical protein